MDVNLWLLVVPGISGPLLNSLQMEIKQSRSMSTTAAVVGFCLPWKIVVVCKPKITIKTSALAPTQPPLSLLLSVPSSMAVNHLTGFFRPLQITWSWALKLDTEAQPWDMVAVSQALYGGDQLLTPDAFLYPPPQGLQSLCVTHRL